MDQQHPRLVGRQTLESGSAIRLDRLTWLGSDGRERVWESAERVNSHGAVLLIARLMPSRRLILIRQYRPPAEGAVVEFPAGLIDAGETPEVAALRELREETGYHGRIVRGSPPTYNSPGLTGETVCQFLIDVDETAPENASPTPHLDDSEHIEVELVEEDVLPAYLEAAMLEGVRIDSKVVSYAFGMSAIR